MPQLSRVSAVCQYGIVDFCHVILRGSRFRGTWAWLIKNRRGTTLKLVNPFLTVAIEGELSPYTASKRSLISLRDFPSKKKIESQTDIALSPFF